MRSHASPTLRLDAVASVLTALVSVLAALVAVVPAGAAALEGTIAPAARASGGGVLLGDVTFTGFAGAVLVDKSCTAWSGTALVAELEADGVAIVESGLGRTVATGVVNLTLVDWAGWIQVCEGPPKIPRVGFDGTASLVVVEHEA